jgi:hypothetical protein
VSDDTLTIEYQPRGRGRGTVTARCGDAVLHVDDISPTNAKQRAAFARAVKEKVPAADLDAIEAELLSLAADAAKGERGPSGGEPPAAGTDDPLAATPEDVREEAAALRADPYLIHRVVEDVALLGVAGERVLTATVYLVGVSRLLARPLSAIVQGPSSSGKSYLIEKVSELAPPEAVIRATQMTPQALFHMKPGSLRHRWIVAGERSRAEDDDQAEATRALREMISAGRLSKMMPVKVGAAIETRLIEQEGPIAFVESTTLARVFEEDANRSLMLHTDERAEQTQRVIAAAAAGYRDPGRGRADRRVQVHHALQRMLRPYAVAVPFAERLGALFPFDRVEARRAFPHLVSMVQASALLHQWQRPVDEAGRLVAQPEDYQLARYLLAKPLSRLLRDGISDPARRFYDRLAKRWPYRPKDKLKFTTTEARKEQRNSKSAVRGWLNELHDSDAIELFEEGHGRRPAVWQLTDTPPAERDAAALPAIEEVCDAGGFSQEHNAQVQV